MRPLRPKEERLFLRWTNPQPHEFSSVPFVQFRLVSLCVAGRDHVSVSAPAMPLNKVQTSVSPASAV